MTDNYKDYEWYIKHDFSKYYGSWIAIIDRRVVDSGKNAGELLKRLKSLYPNKTPFLAKIRGRLSVL